MALEPGTNSYVTVEEANQYVAALYEGEIAEAWAEKSEAAKELMLINARMDLDRLPFTGRKATPGQPLMFPRDGQTEAPTDIQYAQIEIALLPFNPTELKNANSAERRARLQKQGVTAFSIGDLSESYGQAGNALVADFPFLANARISRLLSRWLNGGYAVC